jgi:hypothetical protein
LQHSLHSGRQERGQQELIALSFFRMIRRLTPWRTMQSAFVFVAELLLN